MDTVQDDSQVVPEGASPDATVPEATEPKAAPRTVMVPSGTVVLAATPIGNVGDASDRLKALLAESAEVNRRMADTVSALVKGQDTFAAAGQPLPNYEVPVPKDSPLIGKSIGELKFWQSTGGTIVAIRRGQTVILSPGPYAELYSGDVIILVGSPSAAEAAHRLVTTKE